MRQVVRQPWAVTLWTFLGLLEQQRVQALVRRIDRIDEANLTALAHHEPNKLDIERNAALVDASIHPDEAELTAEERRARDLAMVAELDAGRVMED